MYILLIILGIISILSFAPYNLIPSIFIGFISLFIAILKVKDTKKCFFIAFFFGIGYFAFGTWWLFTIPDNKLGTIVFGVAIIVLMTLFYVISALISYRLYKLKNYYFLIFAPVIFTIFEYIRHHLWGGFSWLEPAHAFGYSELSSLFATVGSLGIDFLFFAFVATVAYFFNKSYKQGLMSLLIFATVIFTLIKLTSYINYTHPLKHSIKTLLVQDNFANEDKDNSFSVVSRVKSYYELSKQFNANLTIAPESTISLEQNEVEYDIKKFLKDFKNEELLLGSYYSKNQKIYNSIIRASNLKPIYRKSHLIPFGEYMPNWAKAIRDYIPSFNMNDITAYKHNINYKFKDIKIASSICYELMFDENLRENFSKANLLINISDLAWFNSSWVAPYLNKLVQIRAMEYAKPFIYSVNGGISIYITPKGRVKKENLKKGRFFLLFKLIPYKGDTLYSKYGNKIVLLLAIVWILVAGFISKVFIRTL